MRETVFSELMRESHEVRMHLNNILIAGGNKGKRKKGQKAQNRQESAVLAHAPRRQNDKALLDNHNYENGHSSPEQTWGDVMSLVWLPVQDRQAYIKILDVRIQEKIVELHNISTVNVAGSVLADTNDGDISKNDDISFQLWSILHTSRQQSAEYLETLYTIG